MDNNAELVRLEGFVDKLLTKYNQLKSDYLALQETLRERDAECSDLKSAVAGLSTERTEVGSRVAGLLDRIEQWEQDHVDGAGERAPHGGVQGTLFGDDADR